LALFGGRRSQASLLSYFGLRFALASSNLGRMRRLFLIRHAKAEPSVGRDDYERTLTDRGRDDARRVGHELAARNMLPDVLIHSGAARAKETAEIFAAQWPREVDLQQEVGLYDATQDMLLERARALPDARVRVAFVGHNPGLADLASSLAGSGSHAELRRMAAKFPTCGVAAFDFRVRHWNEIERHSGLLALFLTPAEVEAGTD
jgi:phosphohistidine phosphatase